MSFTMEDVMQALTIVKECKDAELHIDTGDMKLSLFKGDVGDSTRSVMDFSSTACIRPPESTATQAQATPVAETAPAAEVAPIPEATQDASDIDTEGLVPVTANVTNVFYRRASPDEPALVEEGDPVEQDTVICLLEVMKCFRQVTADVKGRIQKICVESNNMVEEGTVLFWIKPE
jgi:acetyl-CoA carboxylase biotin carboxyl carrier protein